VLSSTHHNKAIAGVQLIHLMNGGIFFENMCKLASCLHHLPPRNSSAFLVIWRLSSSHKCAINLVYSAGTAVGLVV